MAMQSYALTPARIGKFKAEILKHATPLEVLGRAGRQVQMPKNNSDTYVARRFLPYGATSSNQNQFFSNGTGDRSAAMAAANQTSEGVTSTPDSIQAVDVTAIIRQYDCLYGFTDKTFNLYEDDIPAAMVEQIGERVTLVNEQICYGALKASTNQYYGGTGTTRATVNGYLTLDLLRKVVKGLQANHAKPVTSMLKAGQNFGTDAVESGYVCYCHTDLEPDIRDLPGFVPTAKYATGTPMPNEIGKVERVRFITTPDLPSLQDAATSVTASTYGLYSTTGTNPDVYPMVITGADAWSQISLRGVKALDPTFIPVGVKSSADPHGQRGYAGTIWWKAALLENDGFLAVVNVSARAI